MSLPPWESVLKPLSDEEFAALETPSEDEIEAALERGYEVRCQEQVFWWTS